MGSFKQFSLQITMELFVFFIRIPQLIIPFTYTLSLSKKEIFGFIHQFPQSRILYLPFWHHMSIWVVQGFLNPWNGFCVCQGAACDILPSGTQVATWPPPVLPPRTLATPPPFSAVDSKSPQPLTGCCHFSHGRCWDGKYIEGQASTITRLA